MKNFQKKYIDTYIIEFYYVWDYYPLYNIKRLSELNTKKKLKN